MQMSQQVCMLRLWAVGFAAQAAYNSSRPISVTTVYIKGGPAPSSMLRTILTASALAGHDMTVYAVKWNHIHQRIFLSASADWTLKLWEGDNPRPVMTFDLNNPVGDAAWSPCSATVFAAVTDDGQVCCVQLHGVNDKILTLSEHTSPLSWPALQHRSVASQHQIRTTECTCTKGSLLVFAMQVSLC